MISSQKIEKRTIMRQIIILGVNEIGFTTRPQKVKLKNLIYFNKKFLPEMG